MAYCGTLDIWHSMAHWQYGKVWHTCNMTKYGTLVIWQTFVYATLPHALLCGKSHWHCKTRAVTLHLVFTFIIVNFLQSKDDVFTNQQREVNNSFSQDCLFAFLMRSNHDTVIGIVYVFVLRCCAGISPQILSTSPPHQYLQVFDKLELTLHLLNSLLFISLPLRITEVPLPC